MDKHATTQTANIRNRAHTRPPVDKIIHVHAPWQPPPRRCDDCGGTREVKDVTGRKKLCETCDPLRNGDSTHASG